MTRTTRTELQSLLETLVQVTGTRARLHLDHASAYGGWVIAETLDAGGESRPFGDRRRPAAAMADVMRFAIRALTLNR